MAYSAEIRHMALEQCQKGLSIAEVSKKLGMTENTIKNWKKQSLSTGSIKQSDTNRCAKNPIMHTSEKTKEVIDNNKAAIVTAPTKCNSAQVPVKKHTKVKPKMKKKNTWGFKLKWWK